MVESQEAARLQSQRSVTRIEHNGTKESLAALLRLPVPVEILEEAPDGTYALALHTAEGRLLVHQFDWIEHHDDGRIVVQPWNSL